jgi:formate dehydrogenase major subunit
MTLAMRDGLIQGMFFLGQNAAVGGSNSHLVQRGLAELDWMVVHDFSENETAEFWRTGPLIESGELGPEDIKTEIFLMPAALSAEKSGTYTNLHRLIQWHDKVVDPPGDSRSESWFIYHLGRRLKALYAESERPSDAPIRNLTWDYPTEGWLEEPSGEAVLKAINGYTWADRRQVEDYQALKDDGSTACGAWLYSGIFPAEGENKARSRRPDGPDGPGTHLG